MQNWWGRGGVGAAALREVTLIVVQGRYREGGL